MFSASLCDLFFSCLLSYFLSFVSGSRNVWSLQDIGTHNKTKTVETSITLFTGSSGLQHYSNVSRARETCVSWGHRDPVWRQGPYISHLIQLLYFHKSFHCAILSASHSDEGFYLMYTCLLIHESPGTTMSTSKVLCEQKCVGTTHWAHPPPLFLLNCINWYKG